MKRTSRSLALSSLLASLLAPVVASAEGGAAPAGGGDSAPAAAPAAPAAAAPSLPAAVPGSISPSGSVVYATPTSPGGAAPDINAGLSSSSRPMVGGTSQDKFDLGDSPLGSTVLRGSATGGVVLNSAPTTLPPFHVVARGETLFDIASRYFGNGWQWPKLWGLNGNIQNPHWIYPGDQVRLRRGGAEPTTGAFALGSGGFVHGKPTVPARTVFLRDHGYVDDPAKDIWGTIGGSPEDQMLLTEGDDVYVDIEEGHDVKIGQELAIVRPLRPVPRGDATGTIVAILGGVRVDRWDPSTRVARCRLVETYDVIERGAKVGDVGRRYDVVPPRKNEVDLWAHVTASLYPHVVLGTNQVVFIDKGEKDGIQPGNRFFAVSRGDSFRSTLGSASDFATADVRYETERPSTIVKDANVGAGNDTNYPDEVIGEIRVLRVRDHTATCIVTNAAREVEPGQLIVARKGY